MKKAISLLLAVLMVLSLAACGAKTEAPAETQAAAAQTDEADKSMAYFQMGAAYNALSQRDQAIAAFQKVTVGPAAENAKAALAELNK